MCGINCIVDFSKSSRNKLEILNSMNHDLQHRGPDNQNVNQFDDVFLGHTRLSIIDLSELGTQPMTSSSKRFHIIFNGEIYNYQDLSKKLQGSHNIKFKSSSDTEVILELIEVFGFKKALEMMEGMFAITCYDQVKKEILLARDRFGEKPIFYFHKKNKLIISSELKPIIRNYKSELSLNYNSIAYFLKKSFIHPAESIFKEVKKVSPATFIRFSIKENEIHLLEKDFYWNYESLFLQSKANINSKNVISYERAKRELDILLEDVVKKTMCSDVPLGAFLSGGYDSSCVVAYMQEHSSSKIKTFSIGFNETEYNEAHHAKKIAEYLGTDHQDLYVDKNNILEIIPKLPHIYSEPFADSSQIPTLLLSKLTKSSVTVSLSGDGGDEIFGGYRRYFMGNRANNFLKNIPYPVRKFVKQSNLIPIILNPLSPILKRSIPRFQNKITKLQNFLDYSGEVSLYTRLAEFNNSPLYSSHHIDYQGSIWDSNLSFYEKAMVQDALESLPGDMLTKVDLAGMYYSLETRVPLLNHRIAEFAMNLPYKYLLKGSEGKFLLKEIVHDKIPIELMKRPKKGFDIPLGSYLRNELKDYSKESFNYGRKKFSEFIDFNEADKLWSEHLNLNDENSNLLWNLISLFSWHEQYLD